jgi:hypothetical protein
MTRPVAVPSPIIYLDAGNTTSYSGTTRWFDLSGFGNNVTWSSVSFVSSGASGISSYFVGDGSRTAPTSGNMLGLPLNSSAWTISIYIMNTTGWGPQRGAVTWGNTTNNVNFMTLDNNSESGGNIAEMRGTGQNSDRPSVHPLSTNQWFNATFTYTTTGLGAKTSYLNGVKCPSTPNGANPSTGVKATGAVGPFTVFGSQGTSGPMIGNVAVVRMWNVTLNDSQVSADFNSFRSRYGL